MIVGPLKNNIQFSVIILLMLCIGLWVNTFVFINANVQAPAHTEDVLYHYFFDSGMPYLAKQIVSLLVILLGALFLNFLTIGQEITSKTNYLPAFFYILFAFSSSSRDSIEPILVANLFVLPSLYFLMNSYREEQALSEFFKAGLFMGLSSFFYIHYLYIFPICMVALIILRAFNWREWVVLIIGLIIPLYIYLSICYLTNVDIAAEVELMKEALRYFQRPLISEYYIGFLAILVLLFVFALLHYLSKGFGGKVKTKKTKYVLLWMLSFCLLIVFFEESTEIMLLPCIVPLSIILGDYLAEIRLKVANTLLVLFMGGFVIVYFHLLGII